MNNDDISDQAGGATARNVGQWFQDMPLTKTHWIAGMTLFMAFVIESWEMMIIIFSSGAIGADFGLNAEQIGSLIGAMFLGMIPGALLWGKLMGPFGRKQCLVWSIGLYGLFPLMSAFAPSFETLWAIRFVCGIVLSGALVVTFPYFEELVPVKVRGTATVYLSAGWPVGFLISIAITVLFMDLGWRWVIGFSSIISFWAIVISRFVPESPYWLAEKGRMDEADEAINRLSEGALVASTIPSQSAASHDIEFMNIFRGSALRVTVVQSAINFCFAFAYWGLASWMPALLAERGLSTPEGLGFMAISALFMFPGYISASYLTGKFGRKKIMLLYIFVSTIAGFAFATSSTLGEMYFWNFTLSFFSLGAWGVWNTWLGEIYDTRNRGAGTAWGVSAQRVANAMAPIIIGSMLTRTGFLQTVTFIAAFLAVTFFASLYLPETEGKVLT